MNPEPMSREWLRIVKYFKSKARLRNRASKHHARRSEPTASGSLKNAKEL
jgi:hypothetical protein